VGIGGVGSWAAEALARTGIGAITLIDMDDVCVTNTNRQIHALRDNVGLAKSEVMAERIRLINPECRVTVIDDFVTADNVAEYMEFLISIRRSSRKFGSRARWLDETRWRGEKMDKKKHRKLAVLH
jgi:Dinucleotide-utilizing enzymes involved in molybdopterin and thiamine biosynthesis family 1